MDTGLDAEEVDVINLVSRYHEITAEVKFKDKFKNFSSYQIFTTCKTSL